MSRRRLAGRLARLGDAHAGEQERVAHGDGPRCRRLAGEPRFGGVGERPTHGAGRGEIGLARDDHPAARRERSRQGRAARREAVGAGREPHRAAAVAAALVDDREVGHRARHRGAELERGGGRVGPAAVAGAADQRRVQGPRDDRQRRGPAPLRARGVARHERELGDVGERAQQEARAATGVGGRGRGEQLRSLGAGLEGDVRGRRAAAPHLDQQGAREGHRQRSPGRDDGDLERAAARRGEGAAPLAAGRPPGLAPELHAAGGQRDAAPGGGHGEAGGPARRPAPGDLGCGEARRIQGAGPAREAPVRGAELERHGPPAQGALARTLLLDDLEPEGAGQAAVRRAAIDAGSQGRAPRQDGEQRKRDQEDGRRGQSDEGSADHRARGYRTGPDRASPSGTR